MASQGNWNFGLEPAELGLIPDKMEQLKLGLARPGQEDLGGSSPSRLRPFQTP